MTSKILLNYKNSLFYPNLPTGVDLPFIIGLYPVCHTTAKLSVPNFHEDLEISFFLKGGATCIREDRFYDVQAGDTVISNAYVPHHMVVTQNGMSYFAITISNSFCKYNSIDTNALRFQEHIHDEQLASLFYQAITIYKSNTTWRNAALKAKVLEILVFLYQNYSTSQVATLPMSHKSWKYIYTAIQYIKENFSRKLSVPEIAQYAGISESHFMREFKRITGSSVTGYINTARCEYARNLLQSGKYKIKDVATLCGCENEEYFTKVFKKHTGQSPSAYIKSILAQSSENL